MRQMVNIELDFMIKELKKLKGRHFNKIYMINPNTFRLKIGGENIIIQIPNIIYLSKKIINESINNSLISIIRKKLNNRVLEDVFLLNGDRIVVFKFGEFNLIFEFFSKGNLILTENNIIKACLISKTYSNREIKVSKEYLPPKNEKISFEKMLDSYKEKYIISGLIKLGLGKVYAKYILKKCKIDEKTIIKDLKEKEIKKIKENIDDLLENLKPYLINDNEYGLAKLENNAKEMENLSEVLDYINPLIESYKESSKLIKLKNKLKKQEELLKRYGENEKELIKKAEWIKNNYEKLELIIQFYKKYGLNKLEEELKGKVEIDKKNKKLIFRVN